MCWCHNRILFTPSVTSLKVSPLSRSLQASCHLLSRSLQAPILRPCSPCHLLDTAFLPQPHLTSPLHSSLQHHKNWCHGQCLCLLVFMWARWCLNQVIVTMMLGSWCNDPLHLLTRWDGGMSPQWRDNGVWCMGAVTSLGTLNTDQSVQHTAALCAIVAESAIMWS